MIDQAWIDATRERAAEAAEALAELHDQNIAVALAKGFPAVAESSRMFAEKWRRTAQLIRSGRSPADGGEVA